MASSCKQPKRGKVPVERACSRFARAPPYIRDMDDLTYWTEKLRLPEQELDAPGRASHSTKRLAGISAPRPS
jgi:hypothetical protein